MTSVSEFADWLHNSLTCQALCLGLHVLCAGMLVHYVWKNRAKTLILLNSPIVTIAGQLALVAASLLLFLAKWRVLTAGNLVKKSQECYVDERDEKMIVFNLVYLWCIEFMYMCYLLKMMRVLSVVKRKGWLNKIKKILGSDAKMIAIAFFWGCLVVGVQTSLKWFQKRTGIQQSDNFLKLYPQFNVFMCDSDIPTQNDNTVVGLNQGKLALTIMLFLFVYYQSFTLERLDKNIRIRAQYFILLSLAYAVMLSDKILKLCNNGTINTALPVHYVDCLTNLLAGALLLRIHFQVRKTKLVLLVPQDTSSIDVTNLNYLIQTKKCRKVLQEYFNSIKYGAAFKYCVEIHSRGFMEDMTPLKVAKIVESLPLMFREKIVGENQSPLTRQKSTKNKLTQFINSEIKNWMKTVSYHQLNQEAQLNKQILQQMEQLSIKGESTIYC